MFKLVMIIFDLIKNLMNLLKLFLIFSSMLYCLYWIQQLTNSQWSWYVFFKPLILPFINITNFVLLSIKKYLPLGSNYIYVIVTYILIYYVIDLFIIAIDISKGILERTNKCIKKIELNHYNNTLAKKQLNEQTYLNNYLIYLKTDLKLKYKHIKTENDYLEQNKIMLEFLSNNLKISYINYQNGYLYMFDKFNDIDNVLKIFSKLINTETILNYKISVQIVDTNISEAKADLLFLDSLNLNNKLSILANTKYRYTFNTIQNYTCKTIGIFQRKQEQIVVYEFTDN